MKEGRLQAEENGLPCEAQNGSQLTARREMGPHDHNHNKLNFATNPNEQENRSSPRASRKEHSPADTLVLAQWDPCRTSDLQQEKINLYCFKPLNLLTFVLAVIENQYTGSGQMNPFLSILGSTLKSKGASYIGLYRYKPALVRELLRNHICNGKTSCWCWAKSLRDDHQKYEIIPDHWKAKRINFDLQFQVFSSIRSIYNVRMEPGGRGYGPLHESSAFSKCELIKHIIFQI